MSILPQRPTDRRSVAQDAPRASSVVGMALAAEDTCTLVAVQAAEFDEVAFFSAVAASDVRALLIGRRALVVLGLPVLTADYDFWIHIDDIDAFNRLSAPFELVPSHSPEDARRRGRYVLENGDRVDVLIAKAVPTVDGVRVPFEDLWARRRTVPLRDGVEVTLPSTADLILTKRFAARPKDAEDIRLLRTLDDGGAA